MKDSYTISDDRKREREPSNIKKMEEREHIQLSGQRTREKPYESIPSYFLLVLLGGLIALGVLTAVLDDTLPDVVSEKDAGYTRFSEERSWRYLSEMVGPGPRVAGTAQHRRKTADLKRLLERIVAGAAQRVHVHWQTASGDYWLAASQPFVNAYGNLSNVVALLEGASGFNPDGTTNSSILLNCHYDTVPTSPGVSDNALFCSVMVEILMLLSRRPEKLKHNIIFLFNGAEENPLQGASGFLQHKWSKGVTTLLNLDAAGTNCKSMMFQVSDPRVARSYARAVRRPSAQAFGEVLFRSGAVPSDTDFRVFRDFGNIYGADIAFSKLGHVYHTRADAARGVRGGVAQHAGDALLALAAQAAGGPEYRDKCPEPSTLVYWDYLNLFMLVYDTQTADIVDSLIVVYALFSVLYYHSVVGFRWSMTRELLLSVAGRLLSVVGGVCALWTVTFIMVATTTQLRYLASSWLVVPMFWFPYLVGFVAASQAFDAWRTHKSGLSRARRAAGAAASARLLLGAALALLLPGAAGARYVPAAALALTATAGLVSVAVLHARRLKAYQQLLLELFLATPALLLTMTVAVKVNTLMLPIMGRSPTLRPDYLVAAINMVLVTLCSMPLWGAELLFSRRRAGAAACAAGALCLAVSLARLHPYRPPALQRHYWFHSELASWDAAGAAGARRAGVWFAHTEVNAPGTVRARLPLALEALPAPAACARLHCDLPMFLPRNSLLIENSLWANFSAPSAAVPAPSLVLEKKTCGDTFCSMEFRMTGPPHNSLMLVPRAGSSLVGWSFSSPVRNSSTFESRPVYFIYYSRATYTETPAPLYFTLSFTVPYKVESEIVDVAFSAHRIQHPEEFTEPYRRLLEAMPDWCNIATFLSTRYNYVF